ncbi:MAG: trigger factor [Candidatus Latescibacteria bacterium]|nr:trigger factor [Candidatus Latescibacterota bacterium]NIM22112.1 trigger factor [Candidatus Latescibacterota bacterium]NIM64662.1 trigger factor [Candidatus Latescibacterota bacterium]NIO01172.1 trigger factor [Candidatus Latescibacterota bacterium]NIO27557.1 trigger factor [Candidatus Latescibacterota bacterium]
MDKELTPPQREERKFTVTVSSPSDCKRILSIEIPQEEVELEKAEVLKKYRRELKVPGFRRGKVPLRYIEKNFGDAIHTDAVQNLLPVVYEEALRREGIEPLGHPKFENVQADQSGKINVDVAVEVRPSVKIEGYRNVTVAVEKREIGDEEVEKALENLQAGFATYRVVDREPREGDYLIIDYAPVLDSGEVDEKEMIRNYPVDLASGNLFPELRDGLIGMPLGEEKRITVTYPDDIPNQELRGKQRTFYVSLREVKEKVIPEIDDAFAKRIGEDIPDLNSLKERIRNDLVEDEERRYKREVEEKIIDEIIETNPFDVPEVMVDNYLTSLIEEDRRRRPTVPSEMDREKEIRELFRETAVRNVKKYFVLLAVKSQEELVVEEEEVDERINEIVNKGGEKVEELKAFFNHPKHRSSLVDQILEEKVINFLRENADVKAA